LRARWPKRANPLCDPAPFAVTSDVHVVLFLWPTKCETASAATDLGTLGLDSDRLSAATLPAYLKTKRTFWDVRGYR